MVAQVYAPAYAMGKSNRGDIAIIRYTAFPYQKFGYHKGIIEKIEQIPYSNTEMPPHVVSALKISPGASEGFAKITIKLPTSNAAEKAEINRVALQPGMTVEADIHQETRLLYQWMINPIHSLGRNLGAG